MIADSPSSFSAFGSLPGNMPVRTPSGQIAWTVSPRCLCVNDNHSANASTACLVMEYAAEPGDASSPAADTVQIRCPLPRSSHAGSSSRAARTCAIALTFHESAKSASVASGPPNRAIPAFAQYRSISPSSALAASISEATPSSDAASPLNASAWPPAAVSHDAATALTASAFRSFSTTLAPSAANRRASAAPIPLPAPVTTTPTPVTELIADLPNAFRGNGGDRTPPRLNCTDHAIRKRATESERVYRTRRELVILSCFRLDLPSWGRLRQAWNDPPSDPCYRRKHM